MLEKTVVATEVIEAWARTMLLALQEVLYHFSDCVTSRCVIHSSLAVCPLNQWRRITVNGKLSSACSLFGNLLSMNKNCKMSSCQYSAVNIDHSETEGCICCNYERLVYWGYKPSMQRYGTCGLLLLC